MSGAEIHQLDGGLCCVVPEGIPVTGAAGHLMGFAAPDEAPPPHWNAQLRLWSRHGSRPDGSATFIASLAEWTEGWRRNLAAMGAEISPARAFEVGGMEALAHDVLLPGETDRMICHATAILHHDYIVTLSLYPEKPRADDETRALNERLLAMIRPQEAPA